MKKKCFYFDNINYDVLYVECFYVESKCNQLVDLWKNAKHKQLIQILFCF